MRFGIGCFIFLFLSIVYGQERSNGYHVRELLFDTLSPVISEQISQNKSVIEYCPDNTCDVIEYSQGADVEVMYDFAIIYFSNESGYIEFTDQTYEYPTGVNVYDILHSEAPKILNKYVSKCGLLEYSHDKKAKEILTCLRNRYPIKTYFTRIDEGYYTKRLVE